MRARLLLLFPLLVLLLPMTGCGITFPPMQETGQDPAPLIEKLLPAPRAGAYQQRWVIERGGLEAFFTLYLRVEPPKSMQMVVLSDLGTTLCEVTLEQIKSETPEFPGSLGQRLLHDMRPLFLPAPPRAFHAVRAEGRLGLYRQKELRREGEILIPTARILIDGWRTDESGRPLYPSSFRIEGRYKATVDVR